MKKFLNEFHQRIKLIDKKLGINDGDSYNLSVIINNKV